MEKLFTIGDVLIVSKVTLI